MLQKQQQKNKQQLNNSVEDTLVNKVPISKEEFEKQANANKKISKKLVATAVVEVCILLMMSLAWYYYQSHRKVLSEDREVMAPYYLYLVDETGEDAFSLTVGNLHPGEVKQIIVGVTNKKTGDDTGITYNVSKDSVFDYELELAYTQNLPLNYKVYELQKVEETTDTTTGDFITIEGTDSQGNATEIVFMKSGSTPLNNNDGEVGEDGQDAISAKNNQEMYDTDEVVNLGQYDIYDTGADGALNLKTTVSSDGAVAFDLDYYLIELEWQEGITFSDYLKETDLVYVIVKAMQLEPEEVTTEAQ